MALLHCANWWAVAGHVSLEASNPSLSAPAGCFGCLTADMRILALLTRQSQSFAACRTTFRLLQPAGLSNCAWTRNALHQRYHADAAPYSPRAVSHDVAQALGMGSPRRKLQLDD